MVNVINLQPQVLNLELYAGDGVEFRLVCTDVNGAPIDMNGTIIAQVKLDRADSSALVSFTVGLMDAYQGIVILSLTGSQTAALVADSSTGKFVGVWDIQWTPSGKQPRTLCQGIVECVTDVTR